MIVVKYVKNGREYDWLRCSSVHSLLKWLRSLSPDVKVISITWI